MDQKWYWIELIGFDRELPDLGVRSFLEKVPQDICGVSLLLYTVDFVCMHTGLTQQRPLPRAACSYGAHPYNEERGLQNWTNFELKRLIDILHSHNIKVLLSFFDLHQYRGEGGTQQDGDFVTAGGLRFQVLATPGHTPGSVCLLCENVLFSGDTLFAGSYGRTDFLGGSSRDMAASLKRLSKLPPETRVLPGHGASSTIEEELRTNPYLRGLGIE